jgi:uncharacterized protein (DUF1800 family)
LPRLIAWIVWAHAFGLIAAPMVVLTPSKVPLRAGTSAQFTGAFNGSNQPAGVFLWTVNGVQGGNDALGRITPQGVYTAPAAFPGAPLTVQAWLSQPPASGSASVVWQNPLPALSNLAPAVVNVGIASLQITGAGFVPDSKVFFNGVPASSQFVSAGQLFAQGVVTNAGAVNVAVKNPDPGGSVSHPLTLQVLPYPSLAIRPATPVVRLGSSLSFSNAPLNLIDTRVRWSVNGIAGGDATNGWIDATGVYTPPATIPPSGTVNVGVQSVSHPNANAIAKVTLWNAVPIGLSIAPDRLHYGAQVVSIVGQGFAPGVQLEVGGGVAPTTYVSPTELIGWVVVAPTSSGVLPFKIKNPDPGGTNSGVWLVAAEPAAPLATRLAAARFLDQAAWGPDATSVAEVQQLGLEGWLSAQLRAPASLYTLSDNASNGLGGEQEEFFVHALTGPDPLRQRVAFALGQIFVVSGLKTGQPRQMAPFLNILANDAFGPYATLLRDVTLSPTMGVYLDMVNNDKAWSATGAAPNENYAREVLQLFSIGPDWLNPDGSLQTDPSGAPIPTYSQADIVAVARAFTGWTFPGPTLRAGHNPPFFLGPMVPVESNHDEDAKAILMGNVLPAGQTAREDLEAVLATIAAHPNVAPFISLRLIQHLVESAPTPEYVARISRVFNDTRGNLGAVVSAILLDPEARAGDDPTAPPTATAGHLREPILYELALLRAAGGAMNRPSSLAALAAGMGQDLFRAPSVFNYYSPLYNLPGGRPAPEFQLVSSASALIRANAAYELFFKELNGGVALNLAEFTPISSSPSDLVDAADYALLYGRLPAALKSLIVPAVQAATDPLARARTALYLVGSSGVYQVEH